MTRVIVKPGICGFTTEIEVSKMPKKRASVNIKSDCAQVIALSRELKELSLFEIMKPLGECEVFEKSAKCPLHLTCLVPVGVLKAIEAEGEMALPRDASIHFEPAPDK